MKLPYLEDLDLTGCTMQQQRRHVCRVCVCLDLDSEWNALLAAVLLRRELSADALDLDEDLCLHLGVPNELNAVEPVWLYLQIEQSRAQWDICGGDRRATVE